MNKPIAIQLNNITKTFGSIIANNKVSLDIRKGEILSLLGENGCGKTTLMNMLAGIYYPDDGEIFINGKEAVIRSPQDAFRYRIGMVHQHFKLVEVFTAVDNIILGEKGPEFSVSQKREKYREKAERAQFVIDAEDTSAPVKEIGGISTLKGRAKLFFKLAGVPFEKLKVKGRFNWLSSDRGAGVKDIASRYGFEIDLNKKIYDMSVSEKQTVEIIKVLYRGADILILDEPTAVLTPQEIEKLFTVLRKMKEDGKAIIIITHKLNEVMAISDRVAVLRRGEHVATVNTCETTEKELTEMMVGRKTDLNIHRAEPVNVQTRLEVKNLSLTNAEGVKVLEDISFEANSGEILGIAGIAGSGQRELLETIAGLIRPDTGSIDYNNPKTGKNENLVRKTPSQIRELGVRLSFVPEDRLGMGLVGNMDIIDNMMLRSYKRGKMPFLDRKNPKKLADTIIHDLEVVTPSSHTPVRRLSGGNIQKVLVGREIASAPTVLMAAYPVRGLDINSSYTIYNLLNNQKENGVAVIFVGEDLDVLLELCDRIIVLCGGKITGVVDGKGVTKDEIGLMMMGKNMTVRKKAAKPVSEKEAE